MLKGHVILQPSIFGSYVSFQWGTRLDHWTLERIFWKPSGRTISRWRSCGCCKFHAEYLGWMEFSRSQFDRFLWQSSPSQKILMIFGSFDFTLWHIHDLCDWKRLEDRNLLIVLWCVCLSDHIPKSHAISLQGLWNMTLQADTSSELDKRSVKAWSYLKVI